MLYFLHNRLVCNKMVEKKACAVSPSLLASLLPIPKDWKPPKQFLLGDPWEYDDNPEDDELFIQASQVIEQGHETSTDAIQLYLASCPSKTEGEAKRIVMRYQHLKWEIDGVLQNQMKKLLIYDERGFLKQLKNRQIGAYLCGVNGHLIVSAAS